MMGDFFRRSFQILALASVGTVVYLNVVSVPTGSLVFLQSTVAGGGINNTGVYQYDPGVAFVPTLFVPGRWRRYQLETAPRTQEIRIKLPLRYSAYLRLNDLFYVQLRLRIEGEIVPAEGFAALKALQYRPTDRDKLVEENLQFLAAEYFLAVNNDERALEKLKVQLTAFFANNNLGELQKRLDTQLRSSWYRLTNVELREIYVPDSEVYAAQTRNLDQVATADRHALLTQIEKESELAIERKRNLEDLAKAEKMSALIAENPDIIEYYKIEKIAPRAGQVILDASAAQRGKTKTHTQNQNQATRGRDGSENKGEAGGEIGGAESGGR